MKLNWFELSQHEGEAGVPLTLCQGEDPNKMKGHSTKGDRTAKKTKQKSNQQVYW